MALAQIAQETLDLLGEMEDQVALVEVYIIMETPEDPLVVMPLMVEEAEDFLKEVMVEHMVAEAAHIQAILVTVVFMVVLAA